MFQQIAKNVVTSQVAKDLAITAAKTVIVCGIVAVSYKAVTTMVLNQQMQKLADVLKTAEE